MSKQTTLLVSGASGQLGRRVVELLLARKDPTLKIVAGTRTPEKLTGLDGAEARALDFEDAATLKTAFAGVDRLLIVSTDALDRPGRRAAQHTAAIKAAEAAGIAHVVYTSAINPTVDSPVLVAGDHRLTEEALTASSLEFTILRNALYLDLNLGSLVGASKGGVLYAAGGDGAQSYVTREDCAAAAAGALASDFKGRRTLDVTGSASIGFAELAAITAKVSGKPVRYQAVSAEEQTKGLIAHGLPAGMAAVLVSFDTAVAQGRADVTSDVVQQLAGRPPQSVEQFLQANIAAFS